MDLIKLEEAIMQLEDFDDSSYIFIESGNRSQESKVVVISIEDVEVNGIKQPQEMEYLLEIENGKDVLRAWSFMRGGKVPTIKEKVNAILFYAENDAYQPIE